MRTFKVGSPLNSRKHHLFADGESRSLCGRWLYFGEQVGDAAAVGFGTQRDDCRECTKRYTKERDLPVKEAK